MNKINNLEGGLRSSAEQDEGQLVEKCFLKNTSSWEKKMENFPKYVRRQNLTRFLALYELFKKVLYIKGSIVECGVFQGFGVMTWLKLSAILEPVNLTRRIYGFDSFAGFPTISKNDTTSFSNNLHKGSLYANSKEELEELISIVDKTRFLGHVNKASLIQGDACKTIPDFVNNNKHLLVCLLFMDFDLYKPTKIALENFLPRMPKGSILAFDELDNPLWPGETLAMIEKFSNKIPKIQRFDFDPYIGYIEI